MPIPTLTVLGPEPSFDDVKFKLNKTIQELNNMLLSLDTLNIAHLSADVIDAGEVNTNLVSIRSNLYAGAYIKLDGNGMIVNNGTFNTFSVGIDGNVTMTSALIQSASGYPKLVMDPANQLFGAYKTADRYVSLETNNASLGGAPVLLFVDGNQIAPIVFDATSGLSLATAAASGIQLITNGGINLYAGSTITIPSFSKLYATSPGQDLDSALASKAVKAASTMPSGAHNHGIAPGTQLMIQGGGYVTWVGASDHVHIQQ